MSRPIDLVLARLDNPRPSGRNRWRCVCPSCGGNKSALSVGIGDDDAVLIRCWKGCDAAAVVGSLGLQLHELFPPQLSGHGSAPMRRRGMLTAGQAMEVTAFECLLVWTAAFNSRLVNACWMSTKSICTSGKSGAISTVTGWRASSFAVSRSAT